MAKKTQTGKGLEKAQGIGNPVRKRLFTVKEAAVYLGRGDYGMRELVWSGEIPVIVGPRAKKQYLDIVDLDNYINKNKSFCK
ncbi:MAG: helix-turn-helix domain-containing protein [Deltaproteobacteria bacterium]|nr:helix-turn-helix domain-containing protein [Deltaproteobacteria bacterium]